MKIMTDHGPVSEAYVDGYEFADVLLEGVMFKIEIVDGKLKCTSHGCSKYLEQFNKIQIEDWMKKAEECTDCLVTAGNHEAWIDES